MADIHGTMDAIAPLLFLKNPNNLPVKLKMPPLEDTKDMFYFFTDILFKGLYYLVTNDYANCHVVNLNDVDIETFFVAIRKMQNMKVKVKLEIVGEIFDKSRAKQIHKSSMEALKSMPINLPLSEYYFELPLNGSIYKISYSLLQ
tara:strand:- start:123 stop:557 length:435 start_codon:yes stop_codon:yes gene_type:complete